MISRAERDGVAVRLKVGGTRRNHTFRLYPYSAVFFHVLP